MPGVAIMAAKIKLSGSHTHHLKNCGINPENKILLEIPEGYIETPEQIARRGNPRHRGRIISNGIKK